jgi:uncharacterized protein
MHVLVSGSSGFIGTALVRKLGADGHQVTRLVRRTPRPGDARWDPASGSIEVGALGGVDAVVHLAGAGIADHRWTADYKRELLDSRVQGTDLLARTIAALDPMPRVMLSASAVGYYGARGDEEVDETTEPGTGFLADLCIRWEAATAPAQEAGIRIAHFRTGLVLSATGGALKKQLPLYKLALGGRVGSGRQWQSWISLADEVGAICHLLAIDHHGPVNLTAPHAVRQRDFAKTLGKVLHRPAVLPIPAFAPKLLLGAELVDNVLVTGQKVIPTVLLATGYSFQHETLDTALVSVLDRVPA